MNNLLQWNKCLQSIRLIRARKITEFNGVTFCVCVSRRKAFSWINIIVPRQDKREDKARRGNEGMKYKRITKCHFEDKKL